MASVLRGTPPSAWGRAGRYPAPVSDLRQDPVFGGYTIVADERARRPRPALPYPSLPEVPEDLCPFCPGHEGDTPPAIRKSTAAGGGWDLRVVPNRYPALRVEGEDGARAEGPYERRDGLGAHEVVIESPLHRADFPEMGALGLQRVVGAWVERIADLERDRRLRHVLVFRNEGLLAGATLRHPHSQVLASPVPPPRTERWMERNLDYHARAGRCRLCVLLEYERGQQQRVVAEWPEVTLLAPYAPKVPFELWIVPNHHLAFADQQSEAVIADVAAALAEAATLLRAVLAGSGWNLVVHHPPNRAAPGIGPAVRKQWELGAHWFIELLPRVVPLAGFEWGGGANICSVAPEAAARLLRNQRAARGPA